MICVCSLICAKTPPPAQQCKAVFVAFTFISFPSLFRFIEQLEVEGPNETPINLGTQILLAPPTRKKVEDEMGASKDGRVVVELGFNKDDGLWYIKTFRHDKVRCVLCIEFVLCVVCVCVCVCVCMCGGGLVSRPISK